VYAAHDEKLNRRVAIKVLRHRSDAQVRRRVLDEARHAAALGDPAVVTVFSVLDEADPPAIVIEFVEGFPIDRFAAQLTFISRQAEFTPSNIQTPEERVKQVFRIKVTLKAGDEKLKPGMSADVWLDEPKS
jgi:serine/threonine protein kinase